MHVQVLVRCLFSTLCKHTHWKRMEGSCGNLCPTLSRKPKPFNKVAASSYDSPSGFESSGSPQLCQQLSLCVSFRMANSLAGPWFSHRGCHLHFPGETWWRASSHVLVGHRHIYFGERSVQILCPFSNLVVFWWWYMSSSEVLDTSPLSDTWLASIFACPVGCACHILDGVLWSAKSFKFSQNLIYVFFLLSFAFLMLCTRKYFLTQG